MSKTLVVSNDAGAATLLSYWCKLEQGEIIYAIYGPAQKIFTQSGFKFTNKPIELTDTEKYNKIIRKEDGQKR